MTEQSVRAGRGMKMNCFMRAGIFFTLIISSVKCQYRFACQSNFCQVKVGPCPKLNCEDGRIIKNATECECCDICVNALAEDQPCNTGELSVLPRLECGPALMCIKGICSPASTKCNKDQRDYDDNIAYSDMVTGKPRAECDAYGFYQLVSCKQGMLCYCVDKEGERIFGTAVHTEKETMNCNCSRDYHEFGGKMKHPDQFLRCLPNGNYDPLQCTDEYCFCVGADGKIDGRIIESNGTLAALQCYDAKRHRDTTSKCWREYMDVYEQIESYEQKGVKVTGVDLPHCELDGSYAAVQCKINECYCVKKDGSRYEQSYSVNRDSEQAKDMTCRCIREKELFRNEKDVLEQFARYKCAKNGNYQPLQCVDSMCFCVDEMGFQNSEAVLMNDRQSLKCYSGEYEASWE